MNKKKRVKKMITIIENVKPFYVETIAEALDDVGYRQVTDDNGAIKSELREYKKKLIDEFAEKLKDRFKGKFTCYIYSDGYTNIGNKINDDIDELLKEYKDGNKDN